MLPSRTTRLIHVYQSIEYKVQLADVTTRTGHTFQVKLTRSTCRRLTDLSFHQELVDVYAHVYLWGVNIFYCAC